MHTTCRPSGQGRARAAPTLRPAYGATSSDIGRESLLCWVALHSPTHSCCRTRKALVCKQSGVCSCDVIASYRKKSAIR